MNEQDMQLLQMLIGQGMLQPQQPQPGLLAGGMGGGGGGGGNQYNGISPETVKGLIELEREGTPQDPRLQQPSNTVPARPRQPMYPEVGETTGTSTRMGEKFNNSEAEKARKDAQLKAILRARGLIQ